MLSWLLALFLGLLSSSPAAKNTVVPHLRERREGGEEKEETVICGQTLAEYKQLQLKRWLEKKGNRE